MNSVLNLTLNYQNSYIPLSQPSLGNLALLKFMSDSLVISFSEFSKYKIAQSQQLSLQKREKKFSSIVTLQLNSIQKKQRQNLKSLSEVERVEFKNKEKNSTKIEENSLKDTLQTAEGTSSIKKPTAALKPRKKGKIIFKQPKIDIARFSSRKLSYVSLKLKKQNLLARKVDTWDKVSKKGKYQGPGVHKREVRMLFK